MPKRWYSRRLPVLRSFSPITLVAAAGFVLTLLALVGSTALALARERSADLAAADGRLDNVAALLVEHVSRTLGTVDVLISRHILDFAEQDLPLDEFAHGMLRERVLLDGKLAQVLDLSVTDATGVIRHSTNPGAVGINVTDRSYFLIQRDGATDSMYLNDPIASRVPPHARILPVSWPLRRVGGVFAGTVVATLSGAYLGRFFDAAIEGEHGFVVLADGAGRVFLADSRRWPLGIAEPSRLPLLAGRLSAAGGRFVAEGEVGRDRGVWRVAARPVPGTRVLVVAAALQNELLVSWRRNGFVAGALAAAVALVLGAMTLALAYLATRQKADAELARKAQHEAEAAARVKADFLAAMSHEIRTPLTGVLGMADLLAAEPLKGKQKSYVEAVRTSGRHLLSVVNDILDFSRIEAGRLELERVDFPLAELLEQVHSLMMPQATERGLALEFKPDEGTLPVLRGDPTRLRQVLLNLIGNGLKFTHQGGVTVLLRCRPEGEGWVRLRVEVCDTGIGIPEERRTELFEAFSQADRSTARRYGGSGLGLAICRQLVEAMGGRIGVENTPSQGSLFWFEVPLEVGDEVSAEEKAAFDPALVPALRVLVAEDVELNRDLLADMLGRHGHRVVFATNGAEAVELAERGGFDLMLVDVQMPVMDGVEATRRIRALPPPAGRVPIVGLTANVLASEREQYLAAGMDDCLTKPIVWPDLFAALARHSGSVSESGVIPHQRGRERMPSAPPPMPANETERLVALRSYAVLDTPPEEAFDRIARLAAEIVGVPIALVSLVDEGRQWFKARVGLDVAETPREQAFCAHTILSDEVLHVPDASKDPRFAANPLVTDRPGIRFYAGAPLKVASGHRLGTLCAIDTRPRGLDERQRQALRDLAALAVDQLELRRIAREAERTLRQADGPGAPGTNEASSPTPQAGEAALLERAMIDQLRARLPAKAFVGFLRRGIENAERACTRLGALPAGSEELVREAHSLKGTAGSFGLKRISAIAGEIEAMARDNGDASGLMGRLAAAVAATRIELRGADLLAD